MNPKLLAAAALVALSAFPPAAGAQAPPPAPTLRFVSAAAAAKIPLEVREGLTYVRVRVNGSAPAWFVFDTGATINVIDAGLAKSAGAALAEEMSPRSGGTVTRARGLTLALPGLELANQDAVAMPLDDLARFAGHALAGVFGYELLRHAVVRVDYGAATLGVFDPKGPKPAFHGVESPLSVVGHWPVVPVRLEQPGRPAVENRIVLDSGSLAAVSLLTSRLAAKTVELPVNAGIAGVGPGRNRVGRLGRIRIGTWTLAGVPTVFPPAGTGEEADDLEKAFLSTGVGRVGAPVLSRFTVVYDYPRGALRLAPRPGWDALFDYDRSGAVVMAADSSFATFQVLGVMAGSPAAEAGLAAGDVVVTVDGRPAGGLTLPGFRALLRRDGARVVLGVTRGGEPKTVVLRLRTLV